VGRSCSKHGGKRNAYRIWMGKPEGKRPLGKSRRRWENNILRDFREIGWGGMDWIDLAQDRDQWRAVVNTVMNLWVPLAAGKFLSNCTTGGFSRRAQLRGVIYLCWLLPPLPACGRTLVQVLRYFSALSPASANLQIRHCVFLCGC
jgi:hypothetical protein